jgi:DNA polymerase II small subunit
MEQEILKLCMGRGFLLDREMLKMFSNLTEEYLSKVVETIGCLGIEERIITKNIFNKHLEKFKNLIFLDPEGEKIMEFFLKIDGLGFGKRLEINNLENGELEGENLPGKVKLISAPAFSQGKIEVRDFVNHFRSRYIMLKKILEEKNFNNLSSIRKIGGGRGTYTIIAAVLNKRITKNKNLFLEVEDMTGVASVLINQNKKEVFEKGKEILKDDIVAFSVSGTGEMLFANDVFYPDSSLPEKRYSEYDEYVAFISDIHAGSTMFLEKNLLKFVKWLNGEEGGPEQRKIASKVKYLFMNGDNVDGVGVYPGQDRFLDIKDMRRQYKKIIDIIKLIRKDVQILVSPGQHDAVWVGEPQPIIGEEWAPGFYGMDNVTLIPNPSLVEIDGGFKILNYHGASMHGIIEEIEEIRLNYGHDSPTRVVKEMLKRRHLAPTHGLCDYIPCEKDPLVIDIVPDILITGDQHRVEVSTYNNILLIASSCWQSQTPFEEKVGNNPDPCKVPLFNLKTREVKILDFSEGFKHGNVSIDSDVDIEFESDFSPVNSGEETLENG